MDEIKYVFVVLGHAHANEHDIKVIMHEKIIRPQNGELCFYYPYSELLFAYNSKYPQWGMWGVGFSLKVLEEKLHWDNNPTIDSQNDGVLTYRKKRIYELDFTSLDEQGDEVFFVVPSITDWEKVWYNELKPDTNYKQWWCKGIHKGCFIKKTDDEIGAYLNAKNTGHFNSKNYKAIDKKDLFKSDSLIGENDKYILLDLTPEQLHEVAGPKSMKSQTLF